MGPNLWLDVDGRRDRGGRRLIWKAFLPPLYTRAVGVGAKSPIRIVFFGRRDRFRNRNVE